MNKLIVDFHNFANPPKSQFVSHRRHTAFHLKYEHVNAVYRNVRYLFWNVHHTNECTL